MENLVGLISRFYVSAVRSFQFVHQPHEEGSKIGFNLELRIRAGATSNGCEVVFAPAPKIDITGGRYQPVPDFYGQTQEFSNRIEYTIEGGKNPEIIGPLLNNEHYPNVFLIVEGMHKLLTEVASFQATKGEKNIVYARTR